jgi:hypothetical protein
MTAVSGVFAAASLLVAPVPALPAQGLAVADARGISFVDLAGKRLGRLEGLRFATEYVINSGLPRLRDRHGRLWALDRAAQRLRPAQAGLPLAEGAVLSFSRPDKSWLVRRGGRVVLRMKVGQEFPFLSEGRDVVSTSLRALDLRSRHFLEVPRGCWLASRLAVRWILLCGTANHGTLLPTSVEELVDGRRRRLTGPAETAPRGPAGYWVNVRVAPDRRRVLAQWSGECESPAAYLVARDEHRSRPVAGRRFESLALGWTPAGRAVVHFTEGVCGTGIHGGPGVYAIGRTGRPQLIVALTSRWQRVAFWGG